MEWFLTGIRGRYDVVEVTGYSGAGKSSFLNHARERVRNLQIRVLPSVREGSHWSWQGAIDAARASDARSDSQRANAIYASAIGGLPGESPRAVLERVAREGRTVILFDQFEELLRYRKSVGHELLALIGELSQAFEVTHVVATRAEFASHFRWVEARGTQVLPIVLEEISDRDRIRKIIRAPYKAAGVKIDSAVDAKIARWWEAARRSAGDPIGWEDGASGDVGLAHLQALLWRIGRWFENHPEHDGPHFTRAAIDAFESDEKTGSPGELIEGALVRWVQDQTEGLGSITSSPWKLGPTLTVAQVAPRLSTAGLKVPQSLSSLVAIAFRSFVEPPDVPPERAVAWYESRSIGGAGAYSKRHSVAPLIVSALREGLNYLARDDVNILRPYVGSATATNDRVYELVHDCLGAPLAEWARQTTASPAAILGAVTPRRGEWLGHRSELRPFDPDLGPTDEQADFSVRTFAAGESASSGPDELWRPWPDEPAAVTLECGATIARLGGLVWLGNFISRVVFKDIQFVDCSFRGSVFDGCAFANVSFVRCDMSGVLFQDCWFDRLDLSAEADQVGDTGVTLDGCTQKSVTTITGLTAGASLYLLKCRGGEWQLRGCELRQLVVSNAADQVRLRLEACDVRHLSVESAHGLEVCGAGNHVFAAWDPHDVLRLAPSGFGEIVHR